MPLRTDITISAPSPRLHAGEGALAVFIPAIIRAQSAYEPFCMATANNLVAGFDFIISWLDRIIAHRDFTISRFASTFSTTIPVFSSAAG